MIHTLSSAHVHSTFCDGKNTVLDMARAAYEKGFVSLGFSSHAPQTFDPRCCIAPERETEYKKEVLRIKEEYADRMAIYLGTERDMLSCAEMVDYEYYIASVHYFNTPDEGFFPIDGPAEKMKNYVEKYCDGDGLKMAKQYFSLVRDYVLEIKPEIIGHYDLVRYNNSRLHMYDEDSSEYRTAALDALRDMRETGALLEVNTGGIARGYMSDPYPSVFILKEWKNWGGEVIINSDCHDARFLDAAYGQAEELLLSLGYDHVTRLSRNPKKGMWEQVGLR